MTCYFVLCDGALAEGDVVRCRREARGAAGTLVPILVGENTSPEQFEQIFGRVYQAASASEILALVKRVLLATRRM